MLIGMKKIREQSFSWLISSSSEEVEPLTHGSHLITGAFVIICNWEETQDFNFCILHPTLIKQTRLVLVLEAVEKLWNASRRVRGLVFPSSYSNNQMYHSNEQELKHAYVCSPWWWKIYFCYYKEVKSGFI